MREIKFRQPVYTHRGEFIEFHYWGLLAEGNFHGPMMKNNNLFDINSMQYTGLKDKNGVEIYEGDIVWDGNDIAGIDSYSKVEYDEEFSGFIVYTPGSITPLHEALEDGNGTDFSTGKNVSGVYVAGNIYENSELLNK